MQSGRYSPVHVPCVGFCVQVLQGITVKHETVYNYNFTSFLFSLSVSVCVSSSSSDPGLSGDAGSRTRCVCQSSLPCRRHPKSETPVAEEWHGLTAEIQQTALSHRWGVLKLCCCSPTQTAADFKATCQQWYWLLSSDLHRWNEARLKRVFFLSPGFLFLRKNNPTI